MLKRINIFYLIISIFLYIILFNNSSDEFNFIVPLAIFTTIIYSITLHLSYQIQKSRTILAIEVFIYSAIFIFLYNSISYTYRGNFFLFSESDAVFYETQVLKLIDMPFSEAIAYYLTYMSLDDLGMILILLPLYYINDSNLLLNLFYLFVNILIALNIFSLSQNFMSKKYAFLVSISYTLSSFSLFFHSSGLKESFMVLLIILSYNFYYKFLKNKNFLYLLLSLMFISSLLFFRPAISAMIIISLGLGSILQKKASFTIKIISSLIIIFLIAIADILIAIVNHYMVGGFDTLIYSRESEGMIIGSLSFTYAVNILAQLIGPLPTLISENKVMLTFFAPGLIYRILLSFPFWLGVLYIYKTKNDKLYPLVFFVIMEMSALALLLEGLEFRKALPHIGIVFIIAFWFMDKYDNRLIIVKRKVFRIFFFFSIFILGVLIFLWNLK
jgi:hypothetical protein